MSENVQKPRIRFKGFSDAWEQRKLGDTTQIIMGQSPDGSTYSNFPTDYILVQGNADLENGWVKPRIWTTQKTKYAVAGDLIMSVRAPAGSMGKTAYNVVLGRGVAAIKGNEFIFQVLTKMDLEGFWKKLSSGSTFESLNSDNIINANIILPSNLEQDKIGSFFENIDNLITLHQRKVFSRFLQFLRQKKHSFLPISWEQRKLGNIAAKVTEKNTQNSIKETFTNSAEMGVVSQRDFFDHDIAKADKIDGYYIVQENDFIYNPRISVTAPCGPINRNKLGRKGVMSPLYTVFRTNDINPLFLEWYFKSSCWYAYMYFNGDSGARSDRFSIKNELFFDMPIPLPKEDEQRRIGLLLESLNNLITLHQRQLEKLKNIKSALLEKMFV